MKKDLDQDEGNVRKISLKELAQDVIGFQPGEELTARQRHRVPDNYFTVLDAGRDFLLWKKRYGQAVRYLPKNISALLLEMEKLVQKMNMMAIEDGYDYSVHCNECYFAMTQVGNLSSQISHQLNMFLKNEKQLPELLPSQSTRELNNFVSQLKKLSSANQMLMKSAKIFESQLEHEFYEGLKK